MGVTFSVEVDSFEIECVAIRVFRNDRSEIFVAEGNVPSASVDNQA